MSPGNWSWLPWTFSERTLHVVWAGDEPQFISGLGLPRKACSSRDFAAVLAQILRNFGYFSILSTYSIK
jgi:hypothetical protein